MAQASINISITGQESAKKMADAIDKTTVSTDKLEKAETALAKAENGLIDKQIKLAKITDPEKREKAVNAIIKQQNQITKLKSQIEGLTNAEEKYNKQAEKRNNGDMTKPFENLDRAISDTSLKLGAFTSKLKEGFGSGLSSLTTGLTAGIAAATAAIGGALVSFNSLRGSIDETAKSARGLGLTYEELKIFEVAAGDAGTSLSTFENAIKTSSQVIGQQLVNPTKKAENTFNALGLSVEDLSKLTAKQRFDTLYNSLQNVGNETEKAAIATQLFGSEFATSMSNMSTEGFQRAADDVERLGLALDDTTTGSVEAFNDNWARLGMAVEGFGLQIIGGIMPAMSKIGEMFVNSGVSGKEFGKIIGDAINDVLLFLADFGDAFKIAFNSAKTTFHGITLGFWSLYKAALEMWEKFILIFHNGVPGLLNFFIQIVNSFVGLLENITKPIFTMINNVLRAVGKGPIRADFDALKIPEMEVAVSKIPAIQEKIAAVQDKINGAASKTAESYMDLVGNVTDAISTVNDLHDALPEYNQPKAEELGASMGKAMTKGFEKQITGTMSKAMDKENERLEKERLAREKEEAKKQAQLLKEQQKIEAEALKKQAEELQTVFNPISAGLENIVKGSESVSQAFSSMCKEIIANLINLATQKAFNAFFGSGESNWAVNAFQTVGNYFGSGGVGMAASALSSNYSTLSNSMSSTTNNTRNATVNINVSGNSNLTQTAVQLGNQVQRTLQSAFR